MVVRLVKLQYDQLIFTMRNILYFITPASLPIKKYPLSFIPELIYIFYPTPLYYLCLSGALIKE